MKNNELIRLLHKNGWTFYRQGVGSHEIWIKDGKTIAIPNHGSKEVPKGTVNYILKEAGLK